MGVERGGERGGEMRKEKDENFSISTICSRNCFLFMFFFYLPVYLFILRVVTSPLLTKQYSGNPYRP